MAAEPAPNNPHAANPDNYDAETKKRLADTNMANYGSKEHRELRRKAAESESAWNGVKIQEEGVRVWRIEKFKVVDWGMKLKGQKEVGEFGNFYDGDSFIILHAYKDPEADDPDNSPLKYNIHFWLGSNTSQDEMGVAAYKTVELDDLLGDLPVQCREVQGYESKEFLSLFNHLKINCGGIESGFRHVKPEEYKPRLYHCHGTSKKGIEMIEVKLNANEVNSTDCFILDCGLQIYRFDGIKSSSHEKLKANKEVLNLVEERNGRPKKHNLDWDDTDDLADTFWKTLGGRPDKLSDHSGFKQHCDDREKRFQAHENVVIHVSDESGKLAFEEVAKGVLDKKIMDDENYHDDVLIFDVGRVIFVWLGEKCNKNEQAEAMNFACQYLADSGRPMDVQIKRIIHGKEPPSFDLCFGCEHVPASII